MPHSLEQAVAELSSVRPAAGARSGAKGGLQPSANYVYFEAVYRHGSIRKAAQALHIASSALNRRVLDLEEEVGTALFERLPRGVRLTAAGELFLAFVLQARKDLDHLQSQLQRLQGQVLGRVRVGVAESVTPSLLPGAIQTYRREHAGVAFHITVAGPEALSEALLEDGVDLILTHETPVQTGLTALAVVRHPLCALVAPEHPLASRSEVTLSECAKYPWAVPDGTLAARRRLDVALERAGLSTALAVEANSIETLKTFARLGACVCFSFSLGGQAEASGLVRLSLVDRDLADARLYLVARRHRVLPVAAASFAEQLIEDLGAGVEVGALPAVAQ